jgi:hypothetical protein
VLAAVLDGTRTPPWHDSSEAMLMIRPGILRWIMWLATAWESRLRATATSAASSSPCYSPKFFGGLVEMASASIHTSNAVRDVYAAFEEQAGVVENRGKVPLVACTGSEPMKDKYGTNYRPKLELIRWIDRPAEMPDEVTRHHLPLV